MLITSAILKAAIKGALLYLPSLIRTKFEYQLPATSHSCPEFSGRFGYKTSVISRYYKYLELYAIQKKLMVGSDIRGPPS